jgi:AcrR family transcriptional regulator
MEPTARRYGGVTAAQRTADRREKLLGAALELVGTQGFLKTTMTAVCANAGLTERYFYENFRNVEHLVLELMSVLADHTAEIVTDAVDGAAADPAAKLSAAITAFLEQVDADPRTHAVTMVESLSTPALRARRQAIVSRFASMVTEYSQRFYGPRLTNARAELGGVVLVGALGEVMLFRRTGELDVSDVDIVDTLVRQFEALAAD